MLPLKLLSFMGAVVIFGLACSPAASEPTATPEPTPSLAPGSTTPSLPTDIPTEPDTPEAENAQFEMVYVSSGNSVQAIDVNQGRPLWRTQLEESPEVLVVRPGRVWVGARKGFLYALDTSTGDLLLEGQVAMEIADIAISDEAIWVADNGAGTSVERPMIRRLDPTDLTEQATIEVGTVADFYEDIRLEPETLWILVGNTFALHRIDLATNMELSHLPLSEDPGNPDGPRAEGFYGYGTMLGHRVWDEENNKLIMLDIGPPGELPTFDRIFDFDNVLEGDRTGKLYLEDDTALDRMAYYVSKPQTNRIVLYGTEGSYSINQGHEIPEEPGHFAVRRNLIYANAAVAGGELFVYDISAVVNPGSRSELPEYGDIVRTIPGTYGELIALCPTIKSGPC